MGAHARIPKYNVILGSWQYAMQVRNISQVIMSQESSSVCLLAYADDDHSAAVKILHFLAESGVTVLDGTSEWFSNLVTATCVIVVISDGFLRSRMCEVKLTAAHDAQKTLIPVGALCLEKPETRD